MTLDQISQRNQEVIHKNIWSNEFQMEDSRMTLKEEEERGGAMREKEEGNRGRGRGGKRALK